MFLLQAIVIWKSTMQRR